MSNVASNWKTLRRSQRKATFRCLLKNFELRCWWAHEIKNFTVDKIVFSLLKWFITVVSDPLNDSFQVKLRQEVLYNEAALADCPQRTIACAAHFSCLRCAVSPVCSWLWTKHGIIHVVFSRFFQERPDTLIRTCFKLKKRCWSVSTWREDSFVFVSGGVYARGVQTPSSTALQSSSLHSARVDELTNRRRVPFPCRYTHGQLSGVIKTQNCRSIMVMGPDK